MITLFTSIVRTKTILRNQTVDIPEDLNINSKGHAAVGQGPTGTLGGDFNRVPVELRLLGKKSSSGLTIKIKWQALLCL